VRAFTKDIRVCVYMCALLIVFLCTSYIQACASDFLSRVNICLYLGSRV